MTISPAGEIGSPDREPDKHKGERGPAARPFKLKATAHPCVSLRGLDNDFRVSPFGISTEAYWAAFGPVFTIFIVLRFVQWDGCIG